jgi:hypothetical protein
MSNGIQDPLDHDSTMTKPTGGSAAIGFGLLVEVVGIIL